MPQLLHSHLKPKSDLTYWIFCVGNQSHSQWLSHDIEVFLQTPGVCFLCFAVFLISFFFFFTFFLRFFKLEFVSLVATNAKWNQWSIFVKAVCSVMCEKPASDSAGEEWVRNSVKVLTWMIQKSGLFCKSLYCSVLFWIITDRQYCNFIKGKELFKIIIGLVNSTQLICI